MDKERAVTRIEVALLALSEISQAQIDVVPALTHVWDLKELVSH